VRQFPWPISNSLILRQDDPAALADFPQPHAVFFGWIEVIAVNFDMKTVFLQFSAQRFDAKRPINKKDGFLRQLRNGSLLRRR
jgi:hypothetical protein